MPLRDPDDIFYKPICPSDKESENQLWAQAAAYMAAHGNAWPEAALYHAHTISLLDTAELERWTGLIDKMLAIRDSVRQ